MTEGKSVFVAPASRRSRREAGLSMRRAAFLTALVVATARTALGYSPCEDATLGAVDFSNPLRSESAPTTLVCNAELASVADDSAVVTWEIGRASCRER